VEERGLERKLVEVAERERWTEKPHISRKQTFKFLSSSKYYKKQHSGYSRWLNINFRLSLLLKPISLLLLFVICNLFIQLFPTSFLPYIVEVDASSGSVLLSVGYWISCSGRKIKC